MIVAWHEVPGNRPPREPSRRARYDRGVAIPDIPRHFSSKMYAVLSYSKFGHSCHRIGNDRTPDPRRPKAAVRRRNVV